MEGKSFQQIQDKFSGVSSMSLTAGSLLICRRCLSVSTTQPAARPRASAHATRGTALIRPAALLANWKVWPLIQTVNFKLMPLQYRVPFQSTCGIAWVLYLSLLNSRRVHSSLHAAIGPVADENPARVEPSR